MLRNYSDRGDELSLSIDETNVCRICLVFPGPQKVSRKSTGGFAPYFRDID